MAKKIAITTRLIKKGVIDPFNGQWLVDDLEMLKAIDEALAEGKYKMTSTQAVKAIYTFCRMRKEWHLEKYGF